MPLADQIAAGLDAHIDYFVANKHTVVAANRTLGGDPTIQAIISEELDVLRARMLEVLTVERVRAGAVSSVLMSWLVFVRVLCVDWLENDTMARTTLRDTCVGALMGALAPLLDASAAVRRRVVKR
jgi:hypothetical protein